jgi:GT2 family glycosyltransferase
LHPATGSDTQLLLPCTLPAGWVQIDYALHSDTDSLLEIYADFGDGFRPETCIDRSPVEANTQRTRFLHLPRPVRALRLDPLSAPGRFRLDRFDVRTLPTWEALGRALAGKLGLLFKYQCFAPALWRGLGLLLRGQFGEFGRKLFDGLHGNVAEAPATYTPDAAYSRWRENRTLSDADRTRLRDEAASLADPPLISVLVPVHNTPEPLLRACIESVLRQTYPHWQLCLADDASTALHVRTILQEYAQRDSRITVVYRATAGNISAATNSALEVAKGDYIALLDHDDEIAEHALSSVARALVADRSLDMVYSDEDKLEEDGQHSDPFFKPDWSPEYFLACMYTCHLGVYRTSLARQIGGFRSAFDAAQDYDFVLRFTAQTKQIGHIPDVLYHWRKVAGSTACGEGAKPEAHERAASALRAWLADNGHAGSVERTGIAGCHRVRFALKGTPLVSIVIPTACKSGVLHGKHTWFVARCVATIRQQSTYPHVEIIVLYDEVIPPTLEQQLIEHGAQPVRYQRPPGPFDFASKMNAGAALTRGEQLLFLNDDIEVLSADWIESMLEFAQQDGIGAVGAKLLFPNGRLQHGGVLIPDGTPRHVFYAYPAFHPGYFNSQVVPRNWVAVTAACMMTRAEVFQSLGGFDVAFPLNYNDADYCLRLRERGLRCVCTPYARLLHHESVTRDGFAPAEVAAFHRRWRDRLPRDPFYNPNFEPDSHDFRIDPRRKEETP